MTKAEALIARTAACDSALRDPQIKVRTYGDTVVTGGCSGPEASTIASGRRLAVHEGYTRQAGMACRTTPPNRHRRTDRSTSTPPSEQWTRCRRNGAAVRAWTASRRGASACAMPAVCGAACSIRASTQALTVWRI
jgi:hypothetical protein